MKKSWRLVSISCLILSGGCTTLFSNNPDYDLKEYNVPGTITISDGRPYGRELLVAERRDDVAWFKELMEGSKTKVFNNEIAREVEQITSFAAALGLKFDPASGLNYRRDREIGDIQQQIAVEKLQIELDQLRRDTELLRQKLSEQLSPVNSDLGKLANANVADATNAVSVDAADQLKAAIDRLLPALAGRLDKVDSPQAKLASNVGISPYDEFRDRMAYRDLIKSARNAANLDDAHDSKGASLYRINFLATVIPHPKYLRSLGVVELKPEKMQHKSGGDIKFLQEWIRHINTSARYRNGLILVKNTQIKILKKDGLIAEWNVEVGNGDCRGIVSNSLTPNQNCQILSLYFPLAKDDRNVPVILPEVFTEFRSIPGNNPSRPFANALSSINKISLGVDKFKNWDNSFCDADDIEAQEVQLAIDYARAIQRNSVVIGTVKDVIQDAGFSAKRLNDNFDHIEEGVYFLSVVQKQLPGALKCPGTEYGAAILSKENFWATLKDRMYSVDQSIRVYDVGPREQAQQMSTVARSANSLALAASIVGSDPSSGIAAEAAASYSKQAMGRAQAIERIPTVVGYAGTHNNSAESDPFFGWVFGPKARINADKSKILTAHVLKSYDVSVDLVAPRWWPELTFSVRSVWGPQAESIASGTLPENVPVKTIRVPLFKSAGDFDSFTEFLAGDSGSDSSDLIVGGAGLVSGCENTYLTIIGGNGLWRSSQVIVMGQLLDGDKVSVLPSMDGLLIKVPPIPLSKGSLVKPEIEILSPYGVRRVSIPYQPIPESGECTPKKVAADSSTSKDPQFKTYSPARLEFAMPSDFVITVTGNNLMLVDGVNLHGQPGTVRVDAKGESLTASFTNDATKGVPINSVVKLDFLKTGKVIHSESVLTTKSGGQ